MQMGSMTRCHCCANQTVFWEVEEGHAQTKFAQQQQQNRHVPQRQSLRRRMTMMAKKKGLPPAQTRLTTTRTRLTPKMLSNQEKKKLTFVLILT